MDRYEDDHVRIDGDEVLIKSSWWPGRPRQLDRRTIRGVESVALGPLSGRHQVVGIAVGRPRSWFSWERGRRHKARAVVLDLGGLLRPTFTPDDPDAVMAILTEPSTSEEAGG